MASFSPRPMKAWSLLNHVPFDGCLLVFNANQQDFRTKASEFNKKHGFKFEVHAITGASRAQAHSSKSNSDLYITLVNK